MTYLEDSHSVLINDGTAVLTVILTSGVVLVVPTLYAELLDASRAYKTVPQSQLSSFEDGDWIICQIPTRSSVRAVQAQGA